MGQGKFSPVACWFETHLGSAKMGIGPKAYTTKSPSENTMYKKLTELRSKNKDKFPRYRNDDLDFFFSVKTWP